MYHSFAPYEQDFRAWWQSGAFPDVNPLTRDFLTHLTRPDAPRRLWRHQEEALMRVVYACELLQWNELLLMQPGEGPQGVRDSGIVLGNIQQQSSACLCFAKAGTCLLSR